MKNYSVSVLTSLIYHVRNILHAHDVPTQADLISATGAPFFVEVTNLKDFEGDDLHIPCIAIYTDSISPDDYVQIGGGIQMVNFFTIEVIAERQTQLLDLVDIISTALFRDITLYDYTGGKYPVYSLIDNQIDESYPQGHPSELSTMVVEDFTADLPDTLPVNEGDRNEAIFRATIISER